MSNINLKTDAFKTDAFKTRDELLSEGADYIEGACDTSCLLDLDGNIWMEFKGDTFICEEI